MFEQCAKVSTNMLLKLLNFLQCILHSQSYSVFTSGTCETVYNLVPVECCGNLLYGSYRLSRLFLCIL